MVYGLDDTITILQATYVKGDGGAAEATWLPWRTGVRARIQPVQSGIASQHEARQTITRCKIFIEERTRPRPDAPHRRPRRHDLQGPGRHRRGTTGRTANHRGGIDALAVIIREDATP